MCRRCDEEKVSRWDGVIGVIFLSLWIWNPDLAFHMGNGCMVIQVSVGTVVRLHPSFHCGCGLNFIGRVGAFWSFGGGGRFACRFFFFSLLIFR